MNSQTNRMKNMKHISLDEIGKELPFGVPENYFNQFATQMDEQIGYNAATRRKLLKPWMYIAAMFVGILLMGPVFYRIYQNNTVKNAENYESYVLSQIDESSLMDCYVDNSRK